MTSLASFPRKPQVCVLPKQGSKPRRGILETNDPREYMSTDVLRTMGKVDPRMTVEQPTRRDFKKTEVGFPGGAVVESLPASAGDTGSSPGLGGSHMPRSN